MKTSDDLCRAALEGEPLPLGVIDMHSHMGPLGMFHVPDCDAAAMVKIMDRLGVIAAATSANAAWASDMRYGNDMVARAVRDFPGRFLPYCVINPQYTDEAAGELFAKKSFKKKMWKLSLNLCSA